jgi:rRNA maturation endonuclease Nob1
MRGLIFMLKIKQRKVCERCLTISVNNDKCNKCGHDHLRDIIITVHEVKNNHILKSKAG